MIVDLFAGCGGWDVGARLAGLPDPIGFELDPAACATRVAAQMPTIRVDLDGYPPRGRIEGLIASPPCTDFSTAGKQAGRDGATGHLVDVPLAWALALEPDWLAWEQVPPVLPIWEQHAAVLERHGYYCWTGIVCAADHGVPQTRRRAVLLARRDRRPCPPMPTHCETGGMFTQRWVSMADALGWTDGRVGFPRLDDLGTSPDGYRERDWRGVDEPAGVVTEKARSWVVQVNNYTSTTGERYERDVERPSPTVGQSGRSWRFTPSWPYDKPATTVAGDPRITARCHHDEGSQGANATDVVDVAAGNYDGTSAIRLTVRDALILQSFPPDFPVQGTRTAQFRQIGNAVPPRLAQVLLEAVSGP